MGLYSSFSTSCAFIEPLVVLLEGVTVGTSDSASISREGVELRVVRRVGAEGSDSFAPSSTAGVELLVALRVGVEGSG